MRVNWVQRLTAAAAMTAVAGTCLAAKYVPDTSGDVTFDTQATDAAAEAGTFLLDRPGVVIRSGMGGTFDNVLVTSPIILHDVDAVLNTPVIASVNGEPHAIASTFRFNTWLPTERLQTAKGMVLAYGRNNSGTSNNVFLDETREGTVASPGGGTAVDGTIDLTRSNVPGAVLPDGVAVYRANFRNGQNNIEIMPLTTGRTGAEDFRVPNQAAIPAAPAAGGNWGSGFKVLFGSAISNEGIDGPGTAFLSVPTACPDGNGGYYVTQATFNGGIGLIGTGVSVFQIAGPTGPNVSAGNKAHEWSDFSAPRLPGATEANIRFTPVKITEVVDDNETCSEKYVAFGVGSSSSPFSFGGGAQPLLIVVDKLDSASAAGDGFTNGATYIFADPGANVSGTELNNGTAGMAPVTDLRFLVGTATGGASNQTIMFDMNEDGDVAVVHKDRTNPLRVYTVRYYEAIKTECDITGYEEPVIIAQTNTAYDNGYQFLIPQSDFCDNDDMIGGPNNLEAFSGVSIDDDGNISFVGVKEVFQTNEATFDCNGNIFMNRLAVQNTTNALCLWHADSESLHEIAAGGQNGDILDRESIVDQLQLALGFFPIDQSSDAYNGNGMSEEDLFFTATFRSGNPDDTADGGDDIEENGGNFIDNGVETEPVRGIILVEAGEFTPSAGGACCFGCFDDNMNGPDAADFVTCRDGVSAADCLAAGGKFSGIGSMCSSSPCNVFCLGDVLGDGDGDVTLADFTALASNFGLAVGSDRSKGDFNCDGATTLADFTVLANNFGCVAGDPQD
ncbi:MAG: hypothetical protein AAFX05_00900 [Planctomycetota bacterium]